MNVRRLNKNESQLRQRAHGRRGATMVEFVVVVPVFFLVLFAGLEFSSLGTIRATANNAAYEAGRKLVIPGAVASEGVTEAKRIMSIIGVDTLTVNVTPSVITATTKNVTVDISIPYASNAVITPFFTGGVTVNSSITMSTERYDGMVVSP